MSVQIVGVEGLSPSRNPTLLINPNFGKSTNQRNKLVFSQIVTEQFLYDLDQERIEDIKIGVRGALDRIMSGSQASLRAKTSQLMDLTELLKLTASRSVWDGPIKHELRSHDIFAIVQQCPFTNHSFRRPRGYPGDAGLLDYVYRHPDTKNAMDAVTAVGRAVQDVTVNVAPCEAVRQRKDILASEIDEAASRSEGAEILAVACGHLREAEGSQALRDGGVSRFVASDQDETSLEKVGMYRATLNDRIEPAAISVRQLLLGGRDLGTFDLIYAAGLYDYLDERVANRLTTSLFGMLKDGGKLLIPNFRDGIHEEGYMDAYMDWRLIYRSREEIEAFGNGIDAASARRSRYYEDRSGSIGYLELQKV